ncbi:MAG: tetratricopeptide repeat protein [Paracoccaceae bacterium]
MLARRHRAKRYHKGHFLPLVLGVMLAFGGALHAEDNPNLAELRAEMSALSAELDALRTEVSMEDHGGLGAAEAGGVLVRLDLLAENLRSLTGRIEAAENRVLRIAEDGARRIRDAEFRITELEGGDTSLLSATPNALGTANTAQTPMRGEQTDYDAAMAAFEAGQMENAAQRFAEFIASYPDGPRGAEARLYQGRALAVLGDDQNAARTFLKAFSGAPDAPSAPFALVGLALSLDALGQHDQACLTLAEVSLRYPEMPSELAQNVAAHKAELECS